MNPSHPTMTFPPDLGLPLLLGAVALLSSVLCAQAPATARPAPDPAVTALLDRIARTRGISPRATARTVVATGEFVVTFAGVPEPVGKGVFTDTFAGADRARHTSDMGDFGRMEKGMLGELVWEVDPAMGAKVRGGAGADAVRRYFACLRGDDPRPLYREITRVGTERVDDRELTVLRLVPTEGKPDTWFVDADATLVRVDTALPAPESADAAFGMADLMDTQITFADWRQVDGGRFPFRRELRMGQAVVTSVCKQIAVDAPVDNAVFAPPPAVTKLGPEPGAPAFGPDGKPNYQVVERQAQPVASIRVKIKPGEISAQLGILLPEVLAHLNAVGARMAGPPFSRYHGVSDTEIDLEAGIPVAQPFAAKGRVQNGELPAGKVVSCWHVGPYDGLTAAHAGLQAHLAKNGLKARGGVWEVYWTDPGMVPDPAKWKTQLFAPVQ